ncbi:MAG: hypothetical protein AAF745_14725, partial [Planctomycetota bacterium]
MMVRKLHARPFFGRLLRNGISRIALTGLLVGLSFSDVSGQESGQTGDSSPVTADLAQTSSIEMDDDEGLLRFSFQGTPWRDVIEWLAEQSGFALHVG